MRCSAPLAFSFLVLLNQSPGVAVAEGVRTPDDETPTEEESEFDLNLWFLWEFPRTLPSGAKRKSFLGLVHRTIGPDGRLVSWSVLNYWSGPDYQVLFPLFYRTGPEEYRRAMLSSLTAKLA